MARMALGIRDTIGGPVDDKNISCHGVFLFLGKREKDTGNIGAEITLANCGLTCQVEIG